MRIRKDPYSFELLESGSRFYNCPQILTKVSENILKTSFAHPSVFLSAPDPVPRSRISDFRIRNLDLMDPAPGGNFS
jgi:hypothetical protein